MTGSVWECCGSIGSQHSPACLVDQRVGEALRKNPLTPSPAAPPLTARGLRTALQRAVERRD